ncbi:MAG: PAS domain-containing sensor histidine kinase [Gemmatimonadetes bacterium]|nr:PAS domain-containing sensor histidine kinase [Gemmatimonadota bacterium]
MIHDRRVLVTALAGGLPAVAAALIILATGGFTPKVVWTVGLLVVLCWLGFAFAVRERVIRPLQTIANMIAGLREGDFSIRARGASPDDSLGLAFLEVNALGETLRQQRLGALEATALLRRVMAEIDVAVFAFDGDECLRLANRGGERLLALAAERLLGRTAEELGLASCLRGDTTGVRELTFAGRAGRYGLRRSTFRQGGRPHALLVLTDVSQALREEERKAWQRLVRVLGHEINNSLAPIKSVAQSLQARVAAGAVAQPGGMDHAAGAAADLSTGLALIAGRAEALSRFMAAYARLARLPQPRLQPLDVDTWVRRVAGLERRLGVGVAPGAPVVIRADGDQLDQLLINLVTNAVDASLQTGGGVVVGWTKGDDHLDVWVRDDGPGISETANLFVPFFTTKPNGSGIGLALSRQIAEGHGGTLALSNRREGKGCEARVRLPL